MYKLPPVIPTERTPYDILGVGYDAYVDFVKNHHQPEGKRRKMHPEDAERAARLGDRLAEHGYHLTVKGNGPELSWFVRVRSKVDVLFEKTEDVQFKTMDEIKQAIA